MRKDIITYENIQSSFLTCDQDLQIILRTLFVTSKPYSDILKRLLVINNPDCLDMSNQIYQKTIDNISINELLQKQYIKTNLKISRGAHEEIKTYIIITLDNFSTTKKSSKYRDYNINFDIICYNDAWNLNNYKIRPLVIVGYIDGILNSLTNKKVNNSLQSNIKLTGIGQYEFLGCNLNVLNEDISMYSLSYRGKHFSEDIQNINKVVENE